MISTFDLFKIGVEPSSSHTVGRMVAAKRRREGLGLHVVRVTVDMVGSFAWTGKGHGSDAAICLGLLGEAPATIDPDAVAGLLDGLGTARHLRFDDGRSVAFDPSADIAFDFETLLPLHFNGMRFCALAADGALLAEKVHYFIGGGFVVEEGHVPATTMPDVPLPFATSATLVDLCAETGLPVASLQMANEAVLRSPADVEAGLDAICDAMFGCIDRGLRGDGLLPGKLKVKRRAQAVLARLEANRHSNRCGPHEVRDWISTYVITVDEENAAGGRVVTAPTTGAAGIVPAVLRYFRDFCLGYFTEAAREFLLSAAAVGSLTKRNASISGAEVGCQGEIGSAAAIAAAGPAAVLGGSPQQVENAAEIAMKHNLGMTCDPVGGLVQIPCIERNAFGVNKAVVAASLALKGDRTHRVSPDEVVEMMHQAGAGMQSKYKEMSQGGLAVNVAEC